MPQPSEDIPDTSSGDHAAGLRLHESQAMRALLLIAGTLCVVLGVIGLFLPVLPTTPFILLAAACYARASERFYLWLLNHRIFGATLREWRRYRSIPWRTKLWAIGLMSTTLAVSIVFFVRPVWLQVVLASMGVGLAIWLYRIPSRDRPGVS